MKNSAMTSESEKRMQEIKGLQQDLSAKQDRVTALEVCLLFLCLPLLVTRAEMPIDSHQTTLPNYTQLEKQRAIRKFGHLLNAPKGGGNVATHGGKENACEAGN